MIVGHARFVSAGLYSYTSGANSQFQRLGEQIISGSSAAEQNVGGGGDRGSRVRGKAIVAEMISAKTSIDHSCLCPCCLTSSDVITLPPHQRLASISTDHLSLSPVSICTYPMLQVPFTLRAIARVSALDTRTSIHIVISIIS